MAGGGLGSRGGAGPGKGGPALATSWTPGDPQHHLGGGGEGCGSQARESVEHRTGKGGFRGQGSAGGCLPRPGRKGPPLPNREARPDTCFLYVAPSGHFSTPGPRPGHGLPRLPLRRDQSLQGVEEALGVDLVQVGSSGGDRSSVKGGLPGRIPVQLRGSLSGGR